ncbi:TIR domain-containing protein [Catellatospora vulcania]|uniref:TIR domain-containing protein n=1 Tax=Catellatospora vulcania TaxID=1460450 RepID=UPI0018AF9F12|nr:TIR domain-containing protein [Catellatospora vulcania]
MDRSVDRYRSNPLLDFFISYSPMDEAWAVWIAWELEVAGYRVMLQAWDFVAGSNFIEFMDRGVSQSGAVIAVLSENYLRSRYGRMEWQAALRSSPDAPEQRLITVRIEECRLVGLLATITFVDLASATDRAQARRLLLDRIGHAVHGRAKPEVEPAFPPHRPAAGAAGTARVEGPADTRRRHPRGLAADQVPFPPADLESRRCTVLHVAGPGYEKAHVGTGAGARDADDLVRALADGAGQPRPDIVAISGSLTNTGSIREFDEARAFVTGLRAGLGLPAHRIAVVPGPRDVTWAASQAYFDNCEADQVEPEPPYWPKWRHYRRFFSDVYSSVEGADFVAGQPWSLFSIPDLRIVVAGLNSTIAESHRASDHYGWLGVHQTRWFAEEMSEFGADNWLRIGLISQPPQQLRDEARVRRMLADSFSVVLHGSEDRFGDEQLTRPRPTVWKAAAAASPGRAQLVSVRISPDEGGVEIEDSTMLGAPFGQ